MLCTISCEDLGGSVIALNRELKLDDRVTRADDIHEVRPDIGETSGAIEKVIDALQESHVRLRRLLLLDWDLSLLEAGKVSGREVRDARESRAMRSHRSSGGGWHAAGQQPESGARTKQQLSIARGGHCG